MECLIIIIFVAESVTGNHGVSECKYHLQIIFTKWKKGSLVHNTPPTTAGLGG